MKNCTSNGSVESYRAVLALNNRGVSLLELHLYREAMDTFTKAFAFFNNSGLSVPVGEKNRTSSESLVSSEGRSMDVEKMNNILTKTSMLLVKAKTSSSTSYCERKTTELSNLRVVSLDSENKVNHEIVDAALTSQFDTDIHIIRMDDQNGHSDPDDCGYYLESSILLFNLATACYCYASTLLSPENRQRRKGEKCKTVARNILDKSKFLYLMAIPPMSFDTCDESNITDSSEFVKCTLLSILSYHGLLQVVKIEASISTSMSFTNINERQKYYRLIGDQRHKLSSCNILSRVQYQQENEAIISAAAA